MKILKSILLVSTICIFSAMSSTFAVTAPEIEVKKITFEDEKVLLNGENLTTSFEESIFLSNKMDNGGTSDDAKESNVEIANIITIQQAGTYEFSGTLSDGQIAINANKINGDVVILLNNANITCKKAPAIFIYSKDIENENCKVNIELKENSINTITGGKLKQSVEDWNEQNKIQYYVEKGYDDERQYYERYKYDGAISSDISLTFDGNGVLNVIGAAKEGIESKMHIIFANGTYNIKSMDDGINACTDGKSEIIVNGGTIIIRLMNNAEEGDGIDSNGTLTINYGTVYAFACPGMDSGLDADLGTYINGGTVLGTGDMFGSYKTSTNNPYVQVNFSKTVGKGESILILNEDNESIFAFKADRNISNIVFSSDKLNNNKATVYVGNGVNGTVDENEIYTNIEGYDLNKMTKYEASSEIGGKWNSGMGRPGPGGNMEWNPQNMGNYMPNSGDITSNLNSSTNTQFNIIIMVFQVINFILVISLWVYVIVNKKSK